ncbi:Crp/Fnr family transcriptional regulator [Inmirania thermothiophila]|uniref:Cyclic nucleotide-binding protein n=1 Tax=Inmirania thermothiophila TaxID=1750597 RepID=A0A3N1Y7B2_9GAMM|nr:cyclic nucleotide-binding domain-containing protein [Inmirania thermothiophila]ROR34716.1 cyclic nucleotide-binding protein [Inmirania thermothiophila]
MAAGGGRALTAAVAGEALAELLRHPGFAEGGPWRRRVLAAGEAVLREGERSGRVYLVLRGRVRVLGEVRLEGNRPLHPGFRDLGEGEVFGELALFDGRPHSATVVAVDEAEVAEIDGAAMLAFLDAHPEIGYRVLRGFLETLAERLRATTQKAVALFAWGLKAHDIDRHL